MTITIPELYIGACLGSLTTIFAVAGLLWALARWQQAQKRGRG